MILNDGRIREAHSQGMHSFVEAPSHEQQGVPPQQVGYGARITRLEKLAFVLENQPVHFRVSRKDSRLAENVGGEKGTEFRHSIIYKGFRVFSLVS